MIYFATFIFTLLLSHIARAVPACGDDASPKDLYDPVYDDVQQPFVLEYSVTWDDKYDNKLGETKTLTCSKLAHKYPKFKDLPNFPYIGAAFDVKNGFHCGKCWKLRNKKTDKSISLTAVDYIPNLEGFKISKEAFKKLGGKSGVRLEVEAQEVKSSVCGFK